MKLHPLTFVKESDSVFAAQLAQFGFSADGKRNEDDWYACRRYRDGDRYIEITANCHFRDGEPECRVILGHGADSWPDTDWNKIALWRLCGSDGNYPFASIDEIPRILNKMLRDLLNHAQDFLDGDLTRFLEIRATQTREREPYKIYEPQPDGSYTTIVDPESQALKDRYSNPKKA